MDYKFSPDFSTRTGARRHFQQFELWVNFSLKNKLRWSFHGAEFYCGVVSFLFYFIIVFLLVNGAQAHPYNVLTCIHSYAGSIYKKTSRENFLMCVLVEVFIGFRGFCECIGP